MEGVKISTLDEPRYLNSYKGDSRLDYRPWPLYCFGF